MTREVDRFVWFDNSARAAHDCILPPWNSLHKLRRKTIAPRTSPCMFQDSFQGSTPHLELEESLFVCISITRHAMRTHRALHHSLEIQSSPLLRSRLLLQQQAATRPLSDRAPRSRRQDSIQTSRQHIHIPDRQGLSINLARTRARTVEK